MATRIELLGYLVPLVVVLAVVALVLGVGLAILFWLTMGWSVYRSVVEDRRAAVRDAVRGALLTRLYSDDPEWDRWVRTLSDRERTVAETLLVEFLRDVDGTDADRLRDLGDALALPERARDTLETGGQFERLQALTRLTLLADADPYHAADFEPTTPYERAAAVRLLLHCDAIDPATGVRSLLDGTDGQFTVFGQDTLYRVALRDPDALFRFAADAYRSWPVPLLTQVLAVCGHLETAAETDALTWLPPLLTHETPAVRAAAADALGSFGWRADLRAQVPVEEAVADPSPEVRGAVYEMLADWGDEAALTTLLYALVSEEDPRALTRGTELLVDNEEAVGREGPSVLGPAWTWSREHRAFDRRPRETLAGGG